MEDPSAIAEQIQLLVNSGDWKGIRDAIFLLDTHSHVGGAFDPYRDPDRLPWNAIGVSLLRSGSIMEALTVFQSQLRSYNRVQRDTNRRVHKGTPYHFLGQTYLLINNVSYSRENFLLAFVEDILTEIQSKGGVEGIPRVDNAFDCPAPIVLELTFRMLPRELRELYDFTCKLIAAENVRQWLYPEQIVLEYRNYKEKTKNADVVVTRAIEEALFHTNSWVLQDLLEKAHADPSGERMEDLATYLFSCVDGFEPIPRLQTSSFHFDVIIRNLVKDHPLLRMLGEYIGVEAKNIIDTVTSEQLNHFIHKLRLHGMNCGVVFTNEGISGVHYDKDMKYGKSIQVKTFNRDNLIVFDLTRNDLNGIVDGNNLLSVLLKKYEEIRYS